MLFISPQANFECSKIVIQLPNDKEIAPITGEKKFAIISPYEFPKILNFIKMLQNGCRRERVEFNMLKQFNSKQRIKKSSMLSYIQNGIAGLIYIFITARRQHILQCIVQTALIYVPWFSFSSSMTFITFTCMLL